MGNVDFSPQIVYLKDREHFFVRGFFDRPTPITYS